MYQIPLLTDRGTVIGETLTSTTALATAESGKPGNFRVASTSGAGRVETNSLSETSGEGN